MSATPTTPPLNQLVVKIRAAHPGAYDDMDDATLTKRVLSKYPQYSDLAAPAVQRPNPGMTEQPMSGPEKFAAHMSEAGANTAKPAVTASAPNVAMQIWKHIKGEPNTLKDIPEAAVQTFLMAGGMEGEPAAQAAEKPAAAVEAAKPVEITKPAAVEPSPVIDVSKKAVAAQLEKSLDAQPLKPGVKLKDQLNFTKAEPVSQTKIEGSSVIQSHGYDPAANEMHIVTKGSPNVTYVYGDVSAEQAKAFETADSKGKAWAEFKQQSSPLVAKIVNGKRVPVKPVLRAADAAQDLTPQWQAALDRVKAKQAAVSGEVVDPANIGLHKKLPTSAMSILNRQVYYTLGAEIPEHFWDGMTAGKLSDGLGKLGLDDEVIKEANGALYKAGYRRLGNYKITADGAQNLSLSLKAAKAAQ